MTRRAAGSHSKIKAAEVAKGAQTRACGELYVLRLVGLSLRRHANLQMPVGALAVSKRPRFETLASKHRLGWGGPMLNTASLEHTLHSLHEARVHVEGRLRSAQRRRQYHPQVSVQEAAAQDEAIALVDLDRIMTRIRATEAKLGLLSQVANRQ